MHNNFERRIKKLEAKLRRQKITLYFDDGSTTEIRDNRGDLMLKMFYAATSAEELSAQEAKLLDLISKATGAYTPGGGHIFDLVKAALAAGAREMNRALEASRKVTLEAAETAARNKSST
jgi:hypothetical protein